MSHSRIENGTHLFLVALGMAVTLLGLPGPATAEPRPSSDVLVPYFEVALSPKETLTTLFAVCNDSDEPVDVVITVSTNWGVPVIRQTHSIKPDEVHTVNLRDWLVDGRLLDRTMSPEELAHVQAALSGKPSPQDGLWYGTEVAPERAVGSVAIRTTGSRRPDVLWGDYFLVDPTIDCFQGETLVNIDFNQCDVPCTRHVIRFLDGAPFEDGTELVIWTDRFWAPSPRPEPLDESVKVRGLSYDEPGHFLGRRDLTLRPIQVVRVSALDLPEEFGWLDLTTEGPSFIGVRFIEGTHHTSSALHSYCVPATGGSFEGPALQLRKRVNGEDADLAPGPSIPAGQAILWEYEVSNTGTVALSNLTVTDDTGVVVSCPNDALEAGESMTCTGSGVSEACPHVNLGTASALDPDGVLVTAEDLAHYTGSFQAEIHIESAVNGEDADQLPGPSFPEGTPLQWTFTVTNAGEVPLTDVALTDGSGLTVTCPKTKLAAGETMTCTASSTATPGSSSHVTVAQGKPPCGPGVSASDPVHYHVPANAPAIDLEKLTNGEDADQEPGPTLELGAPVAWSYVVTNTGNMALTGIRVTDDRGVQVTCSKTALEPGESVTCTGRGVAQACQYRNVGTATARVAADPDRTVTDQDPSHYTGRINPQIGIEKRTEGQDADTPPGPDLLTGSPVHWTYVITNSGDVPLTGIVVADDYGVAITCPKAALAPAELMTCTGAGTAVAGQYRNVGTASGQPPCGPAVTATDPSHYYGRTPEIGIEKLVNGQDADTPPGVLVLLCTTLQWTYLVTNTGEMALQNVSVVDDQAENGSRTAGTYCPNPIPFLGVTCPKTTLAVGESMICTAASTAVATGLHLNTATASGTPVPSGPQVSDQDPAYYTAVQSFQGCTPGYWKNHTGSWPPTGYAAGQSVVSIFMASSRFPALADDTLLQALAYGGGPGDEGAAEILLRAGVAALLNAAHPSVAYPRTPEPVIAGVNAALAGTRDQMLALAAALDADNNNGCPLH